MKMKQLIDAFVNAIRGPSPVADLKTLDHVWGGSASLVSVVGGGRFGGGMVTRPRGVESYWLEKDKSDGYWNLVQRVGNRPEGKDKKILAAFATLEEAVPELRRESDALKKRQGGFWGAAGGALYIEPGGDSGLDAVERALALKSQAAAAAPQPR
jgi:hypothetical protein